MLNSSVDTTNDRVIIRYSPDEITVEEIEQHLTNAGYEPRDVTIPEE